MEKNDNPEKRLSRAQVEALGYYDFMSYIGASFYQVGGPRSTIRLAVQCGITSDTRVLEVGCGTGYNAVLISKEFGCKVVGVDIAEVSVIKARERAVKEGLSDQVEFQIGDAYSLPFEPGSFDVVITEFVSQFLDMQRSLVEFARVLRPGGIAGINEMCKDSEIPEKPAAEILDAEQVIAEITELPFRLNTPEHWTTLFSDAGLTDIEMNKSQDYLGLRDSPHIIREMGGPIAVFKVLFRTSKYWVLSRVARRRFSALQKIKSVFLRKRSTSKYVGYIIGTGRKPA
jgi:ubiquinone/menaquinone biosynthesis C-methylase UbiE